MYGLMKVKSVETVSTKHVKDTRTQLPVQTKRKMLYCDALHDFIVLSFGYLIIIVIETVAMRHLF